MNHNFEIEVNPDIVFCDLLEGGVMFDLNTKSYFSLNPTGLFVWKAFEAGVNLDVIEEWLAGKYPQGNNDDPYNLRGFISSLQKEGLVVEASNRASETVVEFSPSSDGLPKKWVFPEVNLHGKPLSEVILSPFDPTVPIPE